MSCELEGDEENPGETGADLSAFFADNLEGEFIIWRPGRHCMMVIRGALLEYNVAPVWGFRETPVKTFLASHPNTRYVVRALPGTVAIHGLGGRPLTLSGLLERRAGGGDDPLGEKLSAEDPLIALLLARADEYPCSRGR